MTYEASDRELDEFVRGFVDAALWSSVDNADGVTGGEPLDANYDASDIDPVTMVAFRKVCTAFVEKYGDLIADDDSPAIRKYGRWSLAGHELWLTSAGHGSGFGDGNFPEHDDELYEAASDSEEFELYVGDDGVIYAVGHEPPRGANEARRRVPRESTRRHIARDFSTVPELVSHARTVDGATHVLVAGKRTRLYFPHQKGAYEEATVWHENGYWHGAAPSDRVVVDRLPPGAERIEDYLTRSGRWSAEEREPSSDDLRRAAQAADDAWSAEGRRVFGRRWGDVRYTPAGSGEPGSELRRLHDAFVDATRAWRGEAREPRQRAVRAPNTLSRQFPGRPR